MSERALARPILAYVAAVTAGVWVSFAIDDLQQGGRPARSSDPASA
jgi:hypothetical protein